MPKKTKNIKVWRQGSNRKLIIAIFGIFLCIFGIVCGMFWEDIFNGILQKEMTLRPDSLMYDNWKQPPLKLSLDIYLYNWTNPESFTDLTTKPILQQLGPYRFTERPDKVNITWNNGNSTVTYRKLSYFYFDEEGSNGSLDDQVTTLNAVALSASAKAKQWAKMKRGMVDVGLKLYGQKISVIKSVDELLFSGYSDDMIDMARAMPIFGKDVEVPFDRFGWFYTRNGSADLTGVFNVHTGADDFEKLGRMHSWNYKEHTGFFDSYCGMTNGSAGEFYPTNQQVGGSVALFSPDMCRTVPLDYVETVEIEGIEGYRYSGGARSLDNGTLYPENKCFCGGKCELSGVMNISSCRFGSPVFMSYPHFYGADEFYVNQVEGLAPKQEDHEFYMVLEPKTGIALEVAARFQVNMLVEPIEAISLYDGIPRIFFPLIWFEQKVRITPELAGDLKILPRALLFGQIFAGVCFAIGLILLCWYPLEQFWHRKSHSHTIQPTSDSKLNKNGHIHNEQFKSKSQEKTTSPDSSPLLEKPKLPVTMLPSSVTNDSLATTTMSVNDSIKTPIE